MKYFKFLLLFFCALQHNKSRAQTIFKYWYSEKANICMEIREAGYTSSINESQWMKFTLKNNELRVTYNFSHRTFGRKQKFTFKVIKLTSDSLVLGKKEKQNYLEHFGTDSIIIFKSVDKRCEPPSTSTLVMQGFAEKQVQKDIIVMDNGGPLDGKFAAFATSEAFNKYSAGWAPRGSVPFITF